jgi:lactoylglutathione lyase
MNRALLGKSRLLHTMIRVGNLERSLHFYINILGMKELRRETFSQARFSLVFIGYEAEDKGCVIELTHNLDETDYTHGTGFGHIAITVNDLFSVCAELKMQDVKIVREPRAMAFNSDENLPADLIAFIEDPDGYRIELIEKKSY